MTKKHKSNKNEDKFSESDFIKNQVQENNEFLEDEETGNLEGNEQEKLKFLKTK
ncbi:MAG: hypothetical protein U5K51_16240 [Flavobacteriaceae bacterium]|nr:hypothetical protein [Flavobacteriaceae bacterium]